jgi:hypothetical protein
MPAHGDPPDVPRAAAACALCGGPNDCALAKPAAQRPERCWCVGRHFPRELLDAAQATSCICAACLEAAPGRSRPS